MTRPRLSPLRSNGSRTTIRELRKSQDELKARFILLSQQTPPAKIEVVNQEAPAKGRDSGPPADYVKAFGLYSANNFPEAITAFETFLKNNPQSEYAANALYWIGECHYSLSDLPKAKDIFFKVAGNYPNSPKAPDALLKLGYYPGGHEREGQGQRHLREPDQVVPQQPGCSKSP